MRKRPFLAIPLGLATLFATAQTALAQTSDAEDAVAGLFGLGFTSIWCCCMGLVALIGIGLLVLWVITLIDLVQRDNDEFPSAGENTKIIWLVILLASWLFSLYWLAALVYYFMVMRAMPRSR